MSMQKHQHSGKREAVRPKRQAGAPKKPKGKKAGRILLIIAVVISVIILVIYALLKMWVRMPDLPVVDPLDDASSNSANLDGMVPAKGRKEGIYTFLLVGKDVASGSTDTMLLVTYDVKNKTIHGLNLPRDTMVNADTRSKRLNAVYSYNKGKDKSKQVKNGITALKREVRKLTGILPDFYVLVEWEAIGDLVNALGGVEFEVPFDMNYDDPYQNLHIHQKAGLRKLDGDDAMQVVRFRKNNDGSHSLGDVGRLKIQQDFLKAVTQKCLEPATFLKLPSLVQVFVDNVTTDLTVGNLLALAKSASGMNAETDISFETAPLGAAFRFHGAALVTLDGKKLVEMVNNKLNPYTDDIVLEDLELVYQKENGGFGVTSGKLAEGITSTAPKPKPKPKPKPEPSEGLPPEGGTVPEGPQPPQVPDQPDPVLPDPNNPTQPEPVQPDPNKPSQPDPVLPDPVNPEQPDPVQPDPVQPDPVQPEPPKPAQPDPVLPEPAPSPPAVADSGAAGANTTTQQPDQQAA